MTSVEWHPRAWGEGQGCIAGAAKRFCAIEKALGEGDDLRADVVHNQPRREDRTPLLRSLRFWLALCAAMLIIGGSLLVAAHRADEVAEQYAFNNAADTFADTLGFELEDSNRGDEPEDGTTQRRLAVAAFVLAAFAGAGVVVVTRPSSSKVTTATSGNAAQERAQSEDSPETHVVARRPCPECGEMIAVSARLCRYCRSSVTALVPMTDNADKGAEVHPATVAAPEAETTATGNQMPSSTPPHDPQSGPVGFSDPLDRAVVAVERSQAAPPGGIPPLLFVVLAVAAILSVVGLGSLVF